MATTRTLYAVLGLDTDASNAAIEAAFHEREPALAAQPDERSLLFVAYDTLRQPELRAAYDRKLARQQQANAAAVADAASATVIYATDNPNDIHRPQRRSRALNWAVLMLAAGGTAGFFWLKKPVPKTHAAAPASTSVAAPTLPAMPSSSPTGDVPPATPAPGEPAAPSEPAPASAMNAPAAAAASAPTLPARGSKQPGFDAQYVGWSVFTVRQRSLTGSGVMIGPDRILTNCHVLAGGASNGLVVINGMSKRMSKVEKYARLDGEDACLLYAPGAGNDSIAWGSAASLHIGDTVHTFGHPGGSADIVWSAGQFRARADRGGETFLLSENYCRPGSSGGPLLDNEGRLVGVVTAVQRFQAKGGEPPQYGSCISVTEATARALLSKPLFPIALAPAQYIPNY